MPLVNTTEMFKKAYEGGYAIGAFNVNNMEIVQGLSLIHISMCIRDRSTALHSKALENAVRLLLHNFPPNSI